MNSMVSIVREHRNALSDMISALDASFAVVEFDLKGNILNANVNFLDLIGYSEAELIGQHQSIFLPDEVERSLEHRMCWTELKAGNFKRAVLPRITKAGKRIWIEATYTPVRDCQGEVVKIIKLAKDVTEQQQKLSDLQSKVDAIESGHAVIEFDLRGNVLTANHNFLAAMGYALEEIEGHHHSMFVEPDYAQSSDYREFWRSLIKGQCRARQFKRIAKDGHEVWFEATYCPVFDPDGSVCKIVQFAIDVTDQFQSHNELKSALDGNCIDVVRSLKDFDQEFGDCVISLRQARVHLEASNMVAGRVVSCVQETSQRMTELRSIGDHVFDTSIAGDAAAVTLEAAVDAVREVASDCPELTEKMDILEEQLCESTRISATLRLDMKAMVNRLAVVSLALKTQGEVTNQVTSEMHGIQTSLERSQDLLAGMRQMTSDIDLAVGRTREASGVLAR